MLGFRLAPALAVLAALALQAVGAEARSRRDEPTIGRLRSCPWTPIDKDKIEEPQSQLDAENAEDDDDDDDSSGPGDSASDAGPGYYIPGSGCVLIDGEIDAGPQANRATARSTLGAPGGVSGTDVQWAVTSKFNLTNYRQTEYGDLVTRIGTQIDKNNKLTLPYASVMLGGTIVGLQTSFYDAWQADEFTFRALTATQSPWVAAHIFRPTANTTFSISLEDPTFRRVTVTGYGGVGAPDSIARFRYSSGNWQFILSGAMHQTTLAPTPDAPLAPTDSSFWGSAILGYVRYALPNKAQTDKSYAILQLSYAHQAPGYLGINTTSSAFKIELPGTLNAKDAERANGWNGAAVVSWAWAEKWRSAAFASITDLSFPDIAGRGTLRSTRSAVNLTYTFADSLELTVEAGLARIDSKYSGIPSGNQLSLLMSLQRPFPP